MLNQNILGLFVCKTLVTHVKINQNRRVSSYIRPMLQLRKVIFEELILFFIFFGLIIIIILQQTKKNGFTLCYTEKHTWRKPAMPLTH